MPNLLLFRPKPFEDELASQWIVRLAWHNNQKLNHFSWKQLGLPRTVWDRDIDRNLSDANLTLVAALAGVSDETVRRLSLRRWHGILWGELAVRGTVQWLIQPRIVGRLRRLPAQQFCPLCLKVGTPYFRMQWRLMVPFCLEHRTPLLERCARCTAVVNFHAGDYGRPMETRDFPWINCSRCGFDLRLCETVDVDRYSICENFVDSVRQALNGNWVQLGDAYLHPLLFFRGARILLCVISANDPAGFRVRRAIYSFGGPPAFRTVYTGLHSIPEALDVEERLRVFESLSWVLGSWPERFLEVFKAGLIKSDRFRRRWEVPWWLETHLLTSLNGSYYRPSPLERSSVEKYLNAHGLVTSRNRIRKMLGLSHIENHRYIKNR